MHAQLSSGLEVYGFVYTFSTSILCVWEYRRLWRDCANVEARMSHRCSPMRLVPESLVLAHLCLLLEYHTLCMLKEKALVVLQECLGSCEPSLLAVDVTLC